MNNFEMAIFALGMNLSMGTQAADTNNDSIRIDRNTNGPKPAETIKMRDCPARTGNEKALCNKETLNGTSTTMPNENIRINRNRDSKMSDGINAKNTNIRDNRNAQVRDNRSRNMQGNDLKRNGTQTNASGSKLPDTNPITPNSSSSGNSGSTGSGNASAAPNGEL